MHDSQQNILAYNKKIREIVLNQVTRTDNSLEGEHFLLKDYTVTHELDIISRLKITLM